MAHSFEIGTTYGGLTNLASLTTTPVREPKSTYRPYADVKPLVSGLVRGVGLPVATWSWAVITQAERDKLRSFCSGQSATVFIRTRTMDSSDSYKAFQAVMVWPTLEEERDFLRRVQFQIEFRYLVLQVEV